MHLHCHTAAGSTQRTCFSYTPGLISHLECSSVVSDAIPHSAKVSEIEPRWWEPAQDNPIAAACAAPVQAATPLWQASKRRRHGGGIA